VYKTQSAFEGIDVVTGNRLWEFNLGNQFEIAPLNSLELALYTQGSFATVDVLSGALGSTRTNPEFNGLSHVAEEMLISVRFDVRAFDKKMGSTIFKSKFIEAINIYALQSSLAADGMLYILATDGAGTGYRQIMIGFDTKARRQIWSYETPARESLGPPIIGPDGTVYVVQAGRDILAFAGTVGPSRFPLAMYGGNAQGNQLPPLPAPKITSITGNQEIRLNLETTPLGEYYFSMKTNLANADWVGLTNLVASGTNTTISVPSKSSTMFIRAEGKN
jgi:hypothetical protein